MTALAFVLAVTLAGSIGSLTWLCVRVLSAERQTSAARLELAEVRAELAGVRFEHNVTQQALRSATVKVGALQDIIDRAKSNLGAGLDPRDVVGRIKRLLQEQADTARADLSAHPTDGLFDPRAAE